MQNPYAAKSEKSFLRRIVFNKQAPDVEIVPERLLNDQHAEIVELRKVVKAYREAINWALGCGDDFQPRKKGEGPYWWRTELRRRAATGASIDAEHKKQKVKTITENR